MNKRNYNYSMLRFIAASMVIFAHAFVISVPENYSIPEFEKCFSTILNVPLWGSAAVGIFFWGSGFFISMVCERNESFVAYTKNRLLRLMPMLVIVVLITTFILGPAITSLPLKDYFSSGSTWKYLLNGVFILQHNLPGVFENNAYLPTVNGALWTMPVEVICYFGCYFYYKINKNNRGMRNLGFLLLSIILSIVIILIKSRLGIIYSAYRAMINFWFGMQCFIYRSKFGNVKAKKKYITALSIIAVCLLYVCDYTMEFAMIFGTSVLMIMVLFESEQHFTNVEILGNCSYCMYLIGFPIQQTLISIYGGKMDPMKNAVFALVIDFVIAIILYIFIEKNISKFLLNKKSNP